MVITIRTTTADDVADIVKLNADVQDVHARGLPHMFKPPVYSEQLYAEFKEKLTLPNHFTLIAHFENEAAGYLFAELQQSQDSARRFPSESIYIHHISVAPQFRRRGIGKALLDEARDRGRSLGIHRMALDVWRFNEEARKFFSQYGLEVYNEKMWIKT